jgi:hypothetical protein
MTRRSAVWIALAVGIATVAGLVLAARLRARPAPAGTGWAPDPGPQSVVTPTVAPAAGTEVSAVSTSQASAVARYVEPAEKPLPMWVRLTIVGVSLLAFLAVSLIATKGV